MQLGVQQYTLVYNGMQWYKYCGMPWTLSPPQKYSSYTLLQLFINYDIIKTQWHWQVTLLVLDIFKHCHVFTFEADDNHRCISFINQSCTDREMDNFRLLVLYVIISLLLTRKTEATKLQVLAFWTDCVTVVRTTKEFEPTSSLVPWRPHQFIFKLNWVLLNGWSSKKFFLCTDSLWAQNLRATYIQTAMSLSLSSDTCSVDSLFNFWILTQREADPVRPQEGKRKLRGKWNVGSKTMQEANKEWPRHWLTRQIVS